MRCAPTRIGEADAPKPTFTDDCPLAASCQPPLPKSPDRSVAKAVIGGRGRAARVEGLFVHAARSQLTRTGRDVSCGLSAIRKEPEVWLWGPGGRTGGAVLTYLVPPVSGA